MANTDMTCFEAYNETRGHGGINGLTLSEMFLERIITSRQMTTKQQRGAMWIKNKNVIYLCKYNSQLIKNAYKF